MDLGRLIEQQLPKRPMFDSLGREVASYVVADEIIKFAREYPTYKFWEFIDFSEQVFHYEKQEEILKKIIGKNRDGMTLETTLRAAISKFFWRTEGRA